MGKSFPCRARKNRRNQPNKNKGIIDVPGSTTDLGQSELDTPDLTLVAKTVLSDTLELGVPNPGC